MSLRDRAGRRCCFRGARVGARRRLGVDLAQTTSEIEIDLELSWRGIGLADDVGLGCDEVTAGSKDRVVARTDRLGNRAARADRTNLDG